MVDNWIFWGLGWLFLPRMTIGLLLWLALGLNGLGVILALIGLFLDLTSN